MRRNDRRAELADRVSAAAEEAHRWDRLADELRDWPDARLEAAQQELQTLVARLEALTAEVVGVEGDAGALVSQAAIATRYAAAAEGWTRHLLHERLPPADLGAWPPDG